MMMIQQYLSDIDNRLMLSEELQCHRLLGENNLTGQNQNFNSLAISIAIITFKFQCIILFVILLLLGYNMESLI